MPLMLSTGGSLHAQFESFIMLLPNRVYTNLYGPIYTFFTHLAAAFLTAAAIDVICFTVCPDRMAIRMKGTGRLPYICMCVMCRMMVLLDTLAHLNGQGKHKLKTLTRVLAPSKSLMPTSTP